MKASDRTILVILPLIALAIGFYLLVLAPKQKEAGELQDRIDSKGDLRFREIRNRFVERLQTRGIIGDRHDFAAPILCVAAVGGVHRKHQFRATCLAGGIAG